MIEAVNKSNLCEILPLIRAYMEFYNIPDISDERNFDFFSNFGEGLATGCQFLYRDRESGEAVAFATIYFTFTTSITSKVAVLNDLFTSPDFRGKGIGRSLIEHSSKFAKENGAARLQWVTAPNNEAAQKLYDSMATKKSNWLFYTYSN